MRGLVLAIVIWFCAVPGLAQEQAALIADRVSIAGNDVLVAEGHVEVLYQGRRLSASRIVYDRAADRLTIDGPIVLSDPDGTVILADQADLAADLSEGILTSARLVLDRQLQLAASEIMRIGNRYTRLGRTVASSCKICAGSSTPLWEIRARRVVHDQLEHQIYFDNAQLRFGGVPVFWIPRLRIPDPQLTRTTGFLAPKFRTTTGLGTGIKVPYFIRLGPSHDLTLTPYLSTQKARTLELRYRQAFATGNIDVTGAISRDAIRPGQTRGYATLDGSFSLPRGFRLQVSGETVSDRAYLLDYGISEADRLESSIDITRTRRNEFIDARLIHFNSIREGEVNSRLPSIVADLTWDRRFAPTLIGGTGSLQFKAHGHRRSSDVTTDSDGDGISDGRDTAYASARLGWRRDAVFGPGILGAVMAEGRADIYDISEDALAGGHQARVTGAAALELRWPLSHRTAKGAVQVIEPVVQLIWATDHKDTIPNEDSILAEFDESSLFAIDRLPGNDGFEPGPRANVGLTFTHYAPAGWTTALAFGKVFRAANDPPFSAASGLGGKRSDWLVALRMQGADGMTLTNRLVLNDSFALTKGELRLNVERERFAVASSYLWMKADATEQRSDRVSELVFDGRYDLSDTWTGQFSTRYDFVADRASSAGLRMEYRNECMKVDLSLSRRFTSSTSVQATTDVGLSVELLGFGGSTKAGPARACRG